MEIERIIISTVDRQPAYIHQTLASLALGSQCPEIHLVVDGPSCSYQQNYAQTLKFHFNTSQEQNRMKRATENYARCLKLASEVSGKSLILEDDVVLVKNWREILLGLKEPEEENWLLSLWNTNHEGKSERGYEETLPIVDGENYLVWGRSFGVIYSKPVLNDLFIESFLRMQLSRNYDISYDLAVGALFYFSGWKTYECVPALVTHIGDNSVMCPKKIS